MSQPSDARRRAILLALFVTFLWSTSWVLIKIGLDEIPALTFAGLRYGLASALLLPWLFLAGRPSAFRQLGRRHWLQLASLGVLFYAFTQGAQFVALAHLPAISVNLLWNFTSLVVAVLGIFFLAELPGRLQWVGMGLAILGALMYFGPQALERAQLTGLGVAAIGVLANAASVVLGRDVNRRGDLSPLMVTAISMSLGALLLLTTGAATQGVPAMSWRAWLIIAWLAVVNTALAFTLWNRTLRDLTAVESSVINSSMMIQIPLLAVVFLGERLNIQQILGLVIAAVGTLLVQLRRRPVETLAATPDAVPAPASRGADATTKGSGEGR